MHVSEVMTSEVVSVTEATPCEDMVALLVAHRITALPVVDDDGLLRGVVTEADVLRVAVPGNDQGGSPEGHLPATVGGLMRRFPITVAPDCDLAIAADLMTCTAIKSLPVVQDGRVVGMVSRSDLIRGLPGAAGALPAADQSRNRPTGEGSTTSTPPLP